MIPNFNLTASGDISNHFIKNDIKTFYEAIKYVNKLDYGRSKLAYPLNILEDKKGTCSTKHALIKDLAQENNIKSIKLRMCIYPMAQENTPGVGKVLDRYRLDYILESHVYIYCDEERYDFTFPGKNEMKWEKDILIETEIEVDQIGDYKVEYHKNILKDWIKRDKLSFTLKEMWQIRESCIRTLQTFD